MRRREGVEEGEPGPFESRNVTKASKREKGEGVVDGRIEKNEVVIYLPVSSCGPGALQAAVESSSQAGF